MIIHLFRGDCVDAKLEAGISLLVLIIFKFGG